MNILQARTAGYSKHRPDCAGDAELPQRSAPVTPDGTMYDRRAQRRAGHVRALG